MPSSVTRYLALLRGINVGGKNVIPMAKLRNCFEDLSLTNVRTYIQSGNVLFQSDTCPAKELSKKIEAGLSQRFSYDAQAIVYSRRKYRSIIAAAPDGWGDSRDRRHNIAFLLRGITAGRALAQLPPASPDIEAVTAGPGVLFLSTSKEYQSRTLLMKVMQQPIYRSMTIRNRNTSVRLLELLDSI